MTLITLLEFIIALYCLYFVLYNAFFVVSSFFYKRSDMLYKTTDLHNIAVLVPAYKCDPVIINTVKENLSVSYPKEHWKLFVIADGLQSSTVARLKQLPIEVVEVAFEKSTKVRSLKKCMESKKMIHYDSVVILDADNVMEKDFLHHMDQKLETEQSIQGQRIASNQNNSMAILDGISESLNITTFRQGAEAVGLSVSLCGSGMGFKKEPFLSVLERIDSIGGFDRELEFELLTSGIRSTYLKEAIVYDEKTDEISNFKKQRTRWLSSHFVYLKKYLRRGAIQFLNGNIAYFHSTVLRNLQLPRAINIGLLMFLTVLSLFLSTINIWHLEFWIVLWCINTIATVVVIPRSFFNKQLPLALIKLPRIIFSMFILLFKLKGANESFIHTSHKVRS